MRSFPTGFVLSATAEGLTVTGSVRWGVNRSTNANAAMPALTYVF